MQLDEWHSKEKRLEFSMLGCGRPTRRKPQTCRLQSTGHGNPGIRESSPSAQQTPHPPAWPVQCGGEQIHLSRFSQLGEILTSSQWLRFERDVVFRKLLLLSFLLFHCIQNV